MVKEKVNVLLKYYLSISGTKHLHYGYWEKGEEPTMKNVRLAQERYSDHLISFIPSGTAKILDVGCGVGGEYFKIDGKRISGCSSFPGFLSVQSI
ncbi:MAG: hypothetical protein U9O41_07555 [Candidatus Aerophobetes bacterium]|nr:hypothetical protein [Candidatus Aerophobetes bacterium]